MAVSSVVRLSELEGVKRIDAEYYQPYYFEIQRKIYKYSIETLRKIAFITDGSHELRKYGENGILFLRSQDIFEIGLVVQEPAYISKQEDITLRRCKPKLNNILITKTGNVGASLVVNEDFPDCNIPADIALVKISDSEFSPYFVATYLNSITGRSLIYREMSGCGRPRVVLKNLELLKLPKIPLKVQKVTENIIKEVYKHNKLSQTLYFQAENLLLEELGLKDFKPKNKLSYTANLSKAFGVHRIDAEYFQPAYDALSEHIIHAGYYTIKELEEFNKRGVQPKYVEDGEIKVVISKCLGRTSIDYENLEKTSFQEWEQNPDAQIRPLDILIYTTGAYVGRTNCFLENERRVIASNHVNILRIKKLNPIYVAVFLNSILGQMQVKKFVSGSAQVELYPTGISKFVIWKAPEKIQQKIASLVQQSHEARRKAKELLEEAKRKVEEVINGTL